MKYSFVAYLDIHTNQISLLQRQNDNEPAFLSKVAENYVNVRNSQYRIPNPFLTKLDSEDLLEGLYLHIKHDKLIDLYKKSKVKYDGWISTYYQEKFEKIGEFQLVSDTDDTMNIDVEVNKENLVEKNIPTPPPMPKTVSPTDELENHTNLHKSIIEELKKKHFLDQDGQKKFSLFLNKDDEVYVDEEETSIISDQESYGYSSESTNALLEYERNEGYYYYDSEDSSETSSLTEF